MYRFRAALDWAAVFRPDRRFGKRRVKPLLRRAPCRRPITIAQLTDVHLGPIAGFTPRYWNLKRAHGYANWLRHRRHAYQREVLDRMVADMRAQAPDHIVVTGDLANIGLPQEQINALAWLQSLGPPERVSVIPGNHDIYARSAAIPAPALGRLYGVRAQGAGFAGSASAFPYVRVLGQVALIGVNSAVARRR